ncbi:hypothetical protein FQR65_LT10174 [Abscondita terminalis]|nr:hypothetical protein FQR65_LT10174 [Abscondita terminalis]
MNSKPSLNAGNIQNLSKLDICPLMFPTQNVNDVLEAFNLNVVDNKSNIDKKDFFKVIDMLYAMSNVFHSRKGISGLVTGAIPTLNSSSYVELDNNALIVQDEPVNLTMESISSPRPQFDFEVVAVPSYKHKHPDLLDKLTPNVGTLRVAVREMSEVQGTGLVNTKSIEGFDRGYKSSKNLHSGDMKADTFSSLF